MSYARLASRAGSVGTLDRSQTLGRNLYGLADEQLLELVVAGRATRCGQEWDSAKEAWRHLAARHYDRVRGLVVTFRFPNKPDVRIGPGDYDDATQEAYIRAVKMLGNFRGTTLGEFFGALRTCVTNTCMDFCRGRMTRELGIAGSIDEAAPGSDDDGFGRFDTAIGEIASRRDAKRVSARDTVAELGAAIAGLENDEMREVLRCRMAGLSSKETAEKLGLTVANVDQLCSRGIRKLNEVIPDE